MPIEEAPNPQFCTLEVASDLAARLIAIGINVETIYEITEAQGKVSTLADNYKDDGKPHQYVAKVWGGPEQNLGMTDAMFVQNGYTLDSFRHLAAISQKGADTDSLIIGLKGNPPAINANLGFQMKK